MRKPSTLLVLSFLFYLSAFSQPVDVITNLNGPTAMQMVGTDLYFLENDTHPGVLSKIDVTAFPPTRTIVTSIGQHDVIGLIIDGTDAYISSLYGKKIMIVDLTDSIPTPVDLITNLDYPVGMAKKGNYLYFTEYISDKIIQADLSGPTPVLTTLVSGLADPYGLILAGNDLYCAEYTSGRILKLDLTQPFPTPTNVVTGLNGPVRFALEENDLYITQFNGDEIVKIDITAPTPTTPTYVTDGVFSGCGMAIFSNELYFAQFNFDRISKVSITTVGHDELSHENPITVFPNPTSEYVRFSHLEQPTSVTLLDEQGKQVKQAKLKPDGLLELSELPTGIYLIELEDIGTFKVLKK